MCIRDRDEGVEVQLNRVSEELNTHEGNVWIIILSLRPVSYTHLDVYKRQQINITDNAYEIYMMTNKPYSLTFLKYASPYL